MRILMVSSDRKLFEAGSAVRERLAKYAAAAGRIDVVVFALRTDGFAKVDSEHLSITPTNSSSRFLYPLDAYRIAKRFAQPDVVTAQDPFECGWAAARLAAYFKVPLHVQVHTNFLSPSFARAHWPLNRIRLSIAAWVLPRAARVRAVSAVIRDAVQTHYALSCPISVLPIYVDLKKFRNAVVPPELSGRFAQFQKKALVVSRLEREKNIPLALEAFAGANVGGACLIVVGEGRERAALEKRAGELGIAERTFFEGWQEPAPYYKLADAVLCPWQDLEGYSMTVVEALASGTPAIATDSGIARQSGAIIASPTEFPVTLSRVLNGSRGHADLLNYTYASEEDYVQQWVKDVILAAHGG